MTAIPDTVFALVAIVYGLLALFLLFYTDRLKKKVDRQEEENKLRRQEHFNHLEDHHSQPAPLLGVVSPPEGKSKK